MPVQLKMAGFLMAIQIMIDVPDKQIVQLNHDLIGKSRVDSFGMAAGRT